MEQSDPESSRKWDFGIETTKIIDSPVLPFAALRNPLRDTGCVHAIRAALPFAKRSDSDIERVRTVCGYKLRIICNRECMNGAEQNCERFANFIRRQGACTWYFCLL